MPIGTKLAQVLVKFIVNATVMEWENGTLAETLRESAQARKLIFVNDKTFPQLLEETAERNGNRVFLVYGERRLSYRQMNEYSNRLAHRLIEAGVQPGDGVGIMMSNSPEFLFAFFGAQKAGGYAVPVNTDLKRDGLCYILNHSQTKTLFIDRAFLGSLEQVLTALTTLQRVIVFDEMSPGLEQLDDGLENMRYWLRPGLANHNPSIKLSTDSLSCLMYTSGTTGLPKAVTYRHGNSGNKQLVALGRTFFNSRDIFYTPLPLFHANALTVTTVMALGVNGQMVLGKKFSASQFWKEIREHHATTFNALGGMIPILLKQSPSELDPHNDLRLVLSSATPAHQFIEFEKRFSVKLVEAYGAVDGGGFACLNVGDAPAGSIGKPLSGKHRIVNEHGDDMAPGQPGELVFWVGNRKSSEYFKDERATSEHVKDGWLHTGDAVRADKDGFLYFVGRVTESMRRRGENVSAHEVETRVCKYPDVLECAAYGVRAEVGEQDIMVTLVPVEGRTLDLNDLYHFLEEQLPRYAMPRFINVVQELPKTGTHRVVKKELEQIGVTSTTVDMEQRMASMRVSQ
ncbi:MAG: AMP-binding protein [Chloroflexota bacterium]